MNKKIVFFIYFLLSTAYVNHIFFCCNFDKHGMMKQATVSGTESKSLSLVEFLVFFVLLKGYLVELFIYCVNCLQI